MSFSAETEWRNYSDDNIGIYNISLKFDDYNSHPIIVLSFMFVKYCITVDRAFYPHSFYDS